MIPKTRDDLKTWCLRRLGFPVLKVNVDDDQLDDCVDMALQFWQDYHTDGTSRTYLKHQLTAQDIQNEYIPITDNVTGITRIFPYGSTNITVNMFDLRYQLRLHELYDFTSTSYVNYVMTQQHIRTLDMLFSGEQPIRFNRTTDQLFIDWNWGQALAGDFIILEGFVIVDPDTYTKVYNDRTFKALTTAYIKREWGTNMKKFGGMKLPGGVTLSGQQMYDEATLEIEKAENAIRTEWSQPPAFLIG